MLCRMVLKHLREKAHVLWWWHGTKLSEVWVFVQRQSMLHLVCACVKPHCWKDLVLLFRECSNSEIVSQWQFGFCVAEVHRLVFRFIPTTYYNKDKAHQRDKALSVAQPKPISDLLKYDLNLKRFISVLSLKNIPVLYLTYPCTCISRWKIFEWENVAMTNALKSRTASYKICLETVSSSQNPDVLWWDITAIGKQSPWKELGGE